MPDVVCADLHKIRKHRQQDQSSKRCVKSDQKGSESSSSSRTSSGIVLLTIPLSGMNSVLSKIRLLSCWECGLEICKGHEWPSLLWVVCCLVEMSLHWTDHSSREILPSVVCLTQCDQEASAMRRPWPTRGCHAMKTIKLQKYSFNRENVVNTACCNTDIGIEHQETEGLFDLLGRNCCNM